MQQVTAGKCTPKIGNGVEGRLDTNGNCIITKCKDRYQLNGTICEPITCQSDLTYCTDWTGCVEWHDKQECLTANPSTTCATIKQKPENSSYALQNGAPTRIEDCAWTCDTGYHRRGEVCIKDGECPEGEMKIPGCNDLDSSCVTKSKFKEKHLIRLIHSGPFKCEDTFSESRYRELNIDESHFKRLKDLKDNLDLLTSPGGGGVLMKNSDIHNGHLEHIFTYFTEMNKKIILKEEDTDDTLSMIQIQKKVRLQLEKHNTLLSTNENLLSAIDHYKEFFKLLEEFDDIINEILSHVWDSVWRGVANPPKMTRSFSIAFKSKKVPLNIFKSKKVPLNIYLWIMLIIFGVGLIVALAIILRSFTSIS
jgi:hypothetical protein